MKHNNENSIGYSPLMDAVNQGRKEIVKVLLENTDVDLDLQSNSGIQMSKRPLLFYLQLSGRKW